MVTENPEETGQLNPIQQISLEDLLSFASEQFQPDSESQRFVSPLTDFLRELHHIPEVSGVAVSLYTAHNMPRFVCSALLPTPEEAVTADVVKGITQSHAKLHQSLKEIEIITQLRLLRVDPAQTLEELRRDLNNHPDTTCVGIAAFKRQ